MALQDLLRMLRESLDRDEIMTKELGAFIQNQAPKYMKPAAKLNQNVDLEEMVGALKESMEESIIAIESVTKVE
ncbi:Phage protein [Caenorhabditis elegans]|uniref:Phage protein n=1 Tax=Caenorhabditis elegans TaxID=6239 RepID=Q56VZ6_CAEEL|nr:Phage protein [Caenorhabditis elegans]CAI79266.1 Phage protein [Caenorhabditis elegans]|eukprot:NP_001024964.1 Uncharacterized protein CELE_Y66C5A.1 [Caenorhabditis elegans]